MKHAIILGFLLSISAYANAHAIGRGPGGSPAAVGGHSASASGSQGGRYTLGDEFQPWPQAEMQRYAKPKFEPYAGK